MNSTTTRWLPTGAAALSLGISSDTLKRYADRDETLIEGKHFRHGLHTNSPRLWNVEACLERLTHQGKARRAARAD